MTDAGTPLPRSQRGERAQAKIARPSFLVGSATAATILLGLEAWPVAVRAILSATALGLWLMTVVKRV